MVVFCPQLHIFPDSQQALWPELMAIPNEFVLYGGTAIALQLGHRISEDFDFFALQDIDPLRLYRTIDFLKGSRIIQQEPNTLTCLVDRNGPVKVSFFGVPNIRRLEPVLQADGNGLQVASLLDLAATKMHVVALRSQAKDYLDIDALLRKAGIPLVEQLAAAKAVFGDEFAATPTLKALSYFGDGDLRRLPADVQARLAKAAAECDLTLVPTYVRARTTKRTRRRQM